MYLIQLHTAIVEYLNQSEVIMNAAEKQRLEREYGVTCVRQMDRTKRIQKIMVLLSILSFGGSTIFGLGQLFIAGLSPQNQNSEVVSKTEESASSILLAQEKGYQIVLQREPENQIALESLVRIRLQMKNEKGAIAPLEKLVKLEPQREDYKVVLERLKKDVAKGGGKSDSP
jgi:hypothetical protein